MNNNDTVIPVYGNLTPLEIRKVFDYFRKCVFEEKKTESFCKNSSSKFANNLLKNRELEKE